MIRVPVMTQDGVYRIIRTREPRTKTFELYHKAERDAPDLLKKIYAVISQIVQDRPKEEIQRSTALIGRIPSDWPGRDQWLKFLDSEPARQSLFEQVLWTYFFDHDETWETTWPDKDRTGAEYARAPAPPVAEVAPPLSKSATAAPETPSREIAPKSLAPPAASGSAPPVAPAVDEKLKPGDTVEIVNHPYQGKTGVVVALIDDDGLELATVKMQVDGLFEDVSGFLLSQLHKI
jgi:hypothetical protein